MSLKLLLRCRAPTPSTYISHVAALSCSDASDYISHLSAFDPYYALIRHFLWIWMQCTMENHDGRAFYHTIAAAAMQFIDTIQCWKETNPGPGSSWRIPLSPSRKNPKQGNNSCSSLQSPRRPRNFPGARPFRSGRNGLLLLLRPSSASGGQFAIPRPCCSGRRRLQCRKKGRASEPLGIKKVYI